MFISVQWGDRVDHDTGIYEVTDEVEFSSDEAVTDGHPAHVAHARDGTDERA